MILLRLLARCLEAFWRACLWLTPPAWIRAQGRLLFSKSWRRFQHATQHPRAVQTANLLRIVRRNQDTVFGKAHDFGAIQSIADFQKRVPIASFDDLQPYIQRMASGEENVLVTGAIHYFGRTSGTTGPAKLIPVNPEFLAEIGTSRRVWSRQILQTFPKLVRGYTLGMHSPRIEGKTEAGIPYGSITVAIGKLLAKRKQSRPEQERAGAFEKIPLAVFHIDDFNTKYYVLLRLTLGQPITLMTAINPSTIVLICQKLTEFAPELIRDIEQGTLRPDLKLTPEQRALFSRGLSPSRRVADRMRRSLETHGVIRPIDVWPRLCGVLCWKGGSAPFYLHQFPKWLGDLPAMDYCFSATEGHFSVVLGPEGSKGVLAVTGHFFEFVPADQRFETNPPVLTADQLAVGKRYYLIHTASNGLYRYDMNDIIEVVGFYHKTPEIVFCHKGGNMISYTGEKIGESQVVLAVTKSQEEIDVHLTGFCVTVKLDAESPRYVFAVETAAEIPTAKLQALLSACERNLQQANIEYGAKRKSLRLGEPLLAQVPAGAFERWRQDKLSGGAFDSHVKLPHLCADPAILEKLGVERLVEFPQP